MVTSFGRQRKVGGSAHFQSHFLSSCGSDIDLDRQLASRLQHTLMDLVVLTWLHGLGARLGG
jgi:hypothetical protein